MITTRSALTILRNGGAKLILLIGFAAIAVLIPFSVLSNRANKHDINHVIAVPVITRSTVRTVTDGSRTPRAAANGTFQPALSAPQSPANERLVSLTFDTLASGTIV